jgi:hypothetical protein
MYPWKKEKAGIAKIKWLSHENKKLEIILMNNCKSQVIRLLIQEIGEIKDKYGTEKMYVRKINKARCWFFTKDKKP